MILKQCPLISALFLLLSLNTAAQPVEIINLRHRPADEVIPVIRPFLKPGDALTGTDYQLIIRTDLENLTTIRNFIARLDKAPAQLLISVKNSGQLNSVDSKMDIGGTISSDSRRIVINDSGTSENIHVEASRNETSGSRRQTPQIRVTEGRPGLIYTGISVPLKTRQQLRQGNRIIEQERVEYRNVQSGLYVTARLNQDNEVILDIKPQQQSLGESGAINTFNLSTTVRGKLGEWIPLGEVMENSVTSSTQLAGTTSTRIHNRNNVMLKVEKIED